MVRVRGFSAEKMKAAVKRLRDNRFLLSRRKRKKVPALLDLTDSRQYHHVQEIIRRREEILTWFEGECGEQAIFGHGRLRTDQISSYDKRAQKLVEERDRKIVGAILDIARIRREKTRNLFRKVVSEAVEEGGLVNIEIASFLKPLDKRLGDVTLPKGAKKRFRNAFSDWMKAIQEAPTKGPRY